MIIQISSLSLMVLIAVAIHFQFLSLASTPMMLLLSIGFLILLAVFSTGRSLCSLTFKDVQADLVDKGRRGRLVGMASTLSGLITLAVAVPLVWFDSYQSALSVIGLIGIAIIMFMTTFLLMLPIKTVVEVENKSANGKARLKHFIPNLDSDAWRFIIVRSIFVHSALVAPFFLISNKDNATELMAYFLGAEALAALLTANLWGKLADYSARLTLRLAGVLAILACIGLMVLEEKTLWISAAMFFLLSIAHTGVRTGRKTYTLDVKEGQDRTELVGSANSFIGIVLISLGSIYAGLQSVIEQQVVWIMASMLLIGVASTYLLAPEKSAD